MLKKNLAEPRQNVDMSRIQLMECSFSSSATSRGKQSRGISNEGVPNLTQPTRVNLLNLRQERDDALHVVVVFGPSYAHFSKTEANCKGRCTVEPAIMEPGLKVK